MYIVAQFHSNDRKFPLICPLYINDVCTGHFEWEVLIEKELDQLDQ